MGFPGQGFQSPSPMSRAASCPRMHTFTEVEDSESPPSSEQPFGPSPLRLRHLPPLWSLATLTVSSATRSASLLHLATGHGVHHVLSGHPSPKLAAPRRPVAPDPSKPFPCQQPSRVTASPCPLAVAQPPPDPALRGPFPDPASPAVSPRLTPGPGPSPVPTWADEQARTCSQPA